MSVCLSVRSKGENQQTSLEKNFKTKIERGARDNYTPLPK